jgi:hypothetical protein
MTQADVWRGLAEIEAALAAQAKDSVECEPASETGTQRRLPRALYGEAMIALCASVAFGVLIAPWLVKVVALMRPAMPFESIALVSAFANLLFAPSFFAAGILRRCGAAVLGQFGMALPMLVLTPFPGDIALSCLIVAIVSECGLALITRQCAYAPKRIVIAAALAGVLALALNVFAHGFTLTPVRIMVIGAASLGTALLSAIPGACATAFAQRNPGSNR